MEKISQGREEISHHKNELVSRLKGISRENQQLMYMIEVMSRNYNGLQAQLKKQQQEVELRLSSKSMPETLKLDLNTPGGDFNSEGCGKHAIDYSVDSGSTISEMSVEKNSKSFFIENDLLPAKKRRIKNELEQGAKGKEDSYTDGNLPDKKTNEQNNVLVTKGTRSEATTISDGCQWRKYGQKMTRNSLWPRAYYKCAIPSCPVRKKVQKCAQNPNILNTTYEGEHNHMLSPVTMPFPASIATISSIGSSPTITLDLTQNHNPNPNLIPTSGLQPPHPQTTSGSFLQPWVWLYE